MNVELIDKRLREVLINITQLPNEKNNSVTKFEDWGYVNVQFGRGRVDLTANQFSCSLNAEVRITLVENVWDDFAIDLNLFQPVHGGIYISKKLSELDGPPTYLFGPPHFLIHGKHYEDFEDRDKKFIIFPITEYSFSKIEEKYKWIYHDLFLPRLKETLDINFLDSTINDKVEMIDGTDSDFFLNVHGLIFRRIILAKLSGNSLYKDICDYHRSKMPNIVKMADTYHMPHLKKFPLVLETVIERLKDVKPLNDTRLTLNLQ